MRVFIAGGAGALVQVLADHILKDGHELAVLVGDAEAKTLEGLGPRVQLVEGGLGNQSALIEGLRGSQALINLVAVLLAASRVDYERAHVEGVMRLAGACRAMEVKRFIHMSVTPGPLVLHRPYWETRLRGEEVLKHSNLDWTILRPGLVTGLNQPLTDVLARGLGLVNHIPFVERTLGAPLEATTLARAIIQCLNDPQTVGQTLEIAAIRRLGR